jgi:prephenate dehydrogenase
MNIKTIGIIGYGQFGRLMHEYLSMHFEVFVYDIHDDEEVLRGACAADVLIFAVPMRTLVAACETVHKYVGTQTIIVDVISVKVQPLEVLQKYFPKNPILGTHPIFGPQSVKENGGIKNMPIVLVNISVRQGVYLQIRNFLEKILTLKIIEKSAATHDKEMAVVQGISHLIGRALKHMDIEDYETSTHSYKQLIELRDLLQHDSWGVFETIQNNNPYAADIRKHFIEEIEKLESKLNTC